MPQGKKWKGVPILNKYLLLKAVKENLGMAGPGEWKTILWAVFSDGSYTIRVSFIPEQTQSRSVEKNGTMKKDRFAGLCAALAPEWKTNLYSCACDGAAWQFEQYSPEGTDVKSTGELRAIFGNEVLERIAALLPGKSFVRDQTGRF